MTRIPTDNIYERESLNLWINTVLNIHVERLGGENPKQISPRALKTLCAGVTETCKQVNKHVLLAYIMSWAECSTEVTFAGTFTCCSMFCS